MIEHKLEKGLPPRLDLNREIALHRFILDAAANLLLASCHDLSEGGLALALAESSLGPKPTGAAIDHLDLIPNKNALRNDALYFGESQSRVIVSVKPDHKEAVIKAAQKQGVPISLIGKVVKGELAIGDRIHLEMDEIQSIYQNCIPKRMAQ